MHRTTPWRLERYAPLLHARALRLRLGPRLCRRLDPSDLAQEALLRAHQNLAGFRGRTEAELVTWLQEILAHTLITEVRRARARKRDLAREQPLSGRGDSSCPTEGDLASAEPAPWERAEREEQRARLLAALARLPAQQREVLTRRGFQGFSVAVIARQVGRTPKAVANLLFRGRRQLQQLLGNPS
jgi:RNA polymerase sigma-70 factor (ECF subfamily)